MVHTYTLVNPIIIGSLNMTVEASSSALAAKEMYSRLSPYFIAVQPNFIFTIQKLKSNKLQLGGSSQKSYYSFKVIEKETNGEVIYTISTYQGKISYDCLNKTINNVKLRLSKDNEHSLLDSEISGKQFGGKKYNNFDYDDDDDDDDNSSFDKILNELNEDDKKLFPKSKYVNKYVQNPVIPFYIPTLVNPINYYWYSDIYLDTYRFIFPSFIPSVNPRIVVDLRLP